MIQFSSQFSGGVIQDNGKFALLVLEPQGINYAFTNNLRFAVVQFTTLELGKK